MSTPGASDKNPAAGGEVKAPADAWPDAWADESAPQDPPVRVWTREEVQHLRAVQPPLSPWRVLMVQAVAGLLVVLLCGLLTGRTGAAWSALYGAAAVVLPGLLLARGMTPSPGVRPAAIVLRFMLWELVKIVVAVAMLVMAPRFVPGLNWLALLAGLVVSAKASWLVLLWRGRSARTN